MAEQRERPKRQRVATYRDDSRADEGIALLVNLLPIRIIDKRIITEALGLALNAVLQAQLSFNDVVSIRVIPQKDRTIVEAHFNPEFLDQCRERVRPKSMRRALANCIIRAASRARLGTALFTGGMTTLIGLIITILLYLVRNSAPVLQLALTSLVFGLGVGLFRYGTYRAIRFVRR